MLEEDFAEKMKELADRERQMDIAYKNAEAEIRRMAEKRRLEQEAELQEEK